MTSEPQTEQNDAPRRPADRGRGSAALSAIPVRAEAARAGDCSAAEAFALRVLGDAMLPEFADGDIIIIEPEGLALDGSYVLAHWQDEWTFRQLRRESDAWYLVALNPAWPRQPIPDLAPVRGVVIQKSKPGRRRSVKRYVD
jgi:SOS-response transcriptional repressor LexA